MKRDLMHSRCRICTVQVDTWYRFNRTHCFGYSQSGRLRSYRRDGGWGLIPSTEKSCNNRAAGGKLDGLLCDIGKRVA